MIFSISMKKKEVDEDTKFPEETQQVLSSKDSHHGVSTYNDNKKKAFIINDFSCCFVKTH